MQTINIQVGSDNQQILNDLLVTKVKNQNCGLTTEHYSIKNSFGTGEIFCWNFDGLMLIKREVEFHHDIKINGFFEKDSLLLSFLVKGEKKIYVSEPQIELVQEEMESCITFVNTTNGYIFYPRKTLIHEIIIKISDTFIQKHQLANSFPIYKNFSIENLKENFSNHLDYKTQSIINEILSDDKKGLLKRLFLESKVLELLMLQFENEKKGMNNSTVVKKIYLAKDLIKNNLDVQFSIHELSRKVYLNEFQLKKEFKNNFGVTIFEFASHERMIAAKDLLLTSSKPIYEIAELVGYKNPTHFTAAFKKTEGITPKKFRKENL
ncbi:helix-turn-helix domain-containing protein [Tenacibaculum agarivorans]|uniref:helix-turn-helix domain-containing protein n=1 Tax=Tenacibaculum agarivorans TaxID=1908389 RepID=UPI00094B9BE3|nr:helix-turn-helix domain-containing protein [Tenacibaculum agarivorans]